MSQTILLPQTANRRALNGASLAVGKVCAEKGIIGYVSVDFVSFRDADGIVPYMSHIFPMLRVGRLRRPPRRFLYTVLLCNRSLLLL